MRLRLEYAAVSDVGRVRKDNQDSGYAGPWLLTVCDGVGGAARGDIASSTAVQQLRRLDKEPPAEHTDEELLGLVSASLERAHERIGTLVDQDPSLNGTSTTATVALFDGERVAVGHVGDSRAYLFHGGSVRQLTTDHTFVQTLIDEGRITEAEARVHPHRNLILQALDGTRDVDPDLFVVELELGDRLMLCSDGICGVLDDNRIADLLSGGTPDFAAVELVRQALEAGSSDNVTCIVADVAESPADTSAPAAGAEAHEPQLVGAAAELRRKLFPGAMTGLFRGHRMGDTGELEPVPGDDADLPPEAIAADPEEERYRLRPPRRHPVIRSILVLCVVVGVVWIGAAAAWSWSQQQWFVGEQDGKVTIYRGVNTTLLGVDLFEAYQSSDVEVDQLASVYQQQIEDGIHQDDLEAAQQKVRDLSEEAEQEASEDAGTDPSPDTEPRTEPSSEPSGSETGSGATP